MTASKIKWSPNVQFHPYVGQYYERGLVGSKKVLLLGESHYRPSDPLSLKAKQEFTITNFEDYASSNCQIYPRNGFWGRLQCLATRSQNPTRDASAEAWRRLAYANYVQDFVGQKARVRPTPTLWETGEAALMELLRRLRPDVVLVLGRATWNHLGDHTGKYIPVDGKLASRDGRVWAMPTGRGDALSTWVYHPSSSQHSVEKSIRIFEELLACP